MCRRRTCSAIEGEAGKAEPIAKRFYFTSPLPSFLSVLLFISGSLLASFAWWYRGGGKTFSLGAAFRGFRFPGRKERVSVRVSKRVTRLQGLHPSGPPWRLCMERMTPTRQSRANRMADENKKLRIGQPEWLGLGRAQGKLVTGQKPALHFSSPTCLFISRAVFLLASLQNPRGTCFSLFCADFPAETSPSWKRLGKGDKRNPPARGLCGRGEYGR